MKMRIGHRSRRSRFPLQLLLFLSVCSIADDLSGATQDTSPLERLLERHRDAVAGIQRNDTDFTAARDEYLERLRKAAKQYKRDGDLDAHQRTVLEIDRFHRENKLADSASISELPAAARSAQELFRRQVLEAEFAKQRNLVRQWRSHRLRLLDLERLLRASDDDNEADAVLSAIQETEVVIHEMESKLCRPPRESEQPSARLPSGLEHGLLLHYHFDQPFGTQVIDASPHGNHGIMHGAKRYTRGQSLGACWFDGVDDYVMVAPPRALHLEQELTISISVLWQPDSEELHGVSAALLAGGTDAQIDYCLYLTSSRAVGAGVRRTDASNGRLAMPAEPARQKVAVGTWVNVVFTYDGRVARTFIDGRRDKEQLLPGGIGSFNAPLHLGRIRNGRWTYGFRGALDNLIIWNRALTEVEVLGLGTALKMQSD
jgi:hypothetical protein